MIGKNLAHYEVTALLGKGGMGEVYRATDTKLGREVAVKVLPSELASDAERIARFQREARTLATLQHANVASVYGFEDTGDTRFLVMELVEGQDLAERLRNGAIDVDDALELAAQMARGLEAAHEQGIVHRDLKPANVKVSPEGAVKILDFGLARAVLGDPQSETDLAHSPTITAGMTQAGVVLGTAAYMSPEQARGKIVDKRTDIWAFGVICWEMLTGQRLFGGETVSDTFASVLREEIDFDVLPEGTPPALQQVVRRCLVRDPKARLRDIGEARVTLEGGDASGWMTASSLESIEAGMRPPRWPWLLLAGLALLGGLAIGWSARTVDTPLYHLEIMPPPHNVFADRGIHQALSPDGTMLAFVAQDTLERRNLWVRHLDQPVATRLDGTEDANRPFWSPDSRNIGFFDANEMRRIAATGGPTSPLAPIQNPRGGVWLDDGTIVFAPSTRGPLQRVPASGGSVTVATVRDSVANSSERFPASTGRADDPLVYLRWSADDDGLVTLSDGEVHAVVEPSSRGIRVDDLLFHVTAGNLVAQRVGGKPLARVGDAVLLVDDVSDWTATGDSGFSVSAAGPLSYALAQGQDRMTARITDRAGKSRAAAIPDMDFDDLAMSDDGTRFVVAGALSTTGTSNPDGTSGIDLWVYDLPRDVLTRVTFDGMSDDPAFSGDGNWIIYATQGDIARTRASGIGGHEILYEDTLDKLVCDWSHDGDWVVFVSSSAVGSDDLWTLDLRGEDPVAAPLIATPFREYHAEFSPDGRWLAYASNESGVPQVYVVDFPGLTQKVQITRDAAAMPRWSREGNELLVVGGNQRLRAIPFAVDDGRPRVGQSTELLRTELSVYTRTHQFDVDDAGETIVLIEPVASSASREPIHVVTDWRLWLAGKQR